MHRWQISPVVCVFLWSAGLDVQGQQAVVSDLGGIEAVDFQLSPSRDLEADVSQGLVDLPTLSRPAKRKVGAPSGERSPFSSQAYWLPTQNLASQPGNWSQAGTEIKLAAPLSLAEGNVWLATGGVQYTSINTLAVLPDSLIAMPGELWQIQTGVMNFREWDNGWSSGTILTVGSDSDQPFAALRDMTATVVTFVEIPRGDRDAWNLSVFYSPTSQLPYPLPGVAYVWRPSDQFTANLGVPFSLHYRPTETFTLTASYFPLTNVDVLAKWQLNEDWSLYGGYQVVNETYWLDERLDENQRLYLFDQRVTLGLQRKLFAGLSLDLSGGYVFDRQVFQSDSFSDNRRDEIDIDPGFLGLVQLSWAL
ncbi:DUF6268 family outer membrane beta-barrel protein [Bythopirellula goksoeyrii]|uniref:DUF6268 domain-containing protein n=1 Tax=Bythopirellula goksoeyrii TaxID=1400387 RepID=A0A5B9QFN3_9BACT|nr:DUF6268 family outer membrane beta-barrel protein [Bythopirellula goksoeyrii]QEG37828.1 hypothetical protein Pr1d_51760 [Bythopirellula goksoeyrii]